MVPVTKPNESSSVLSAFRPEAMEARYPPVEVPSSSFYLSNITNVPVFPYPPHFGGYVSPELSLLQQKDSRLIQGFMGFHPGFQSMPYPCTDEEKPTQSYIGLIGKAILSSPQKKLVLSDIYNYILTHYPYFRNKGPGWRNSIRHNLSLNDCFIKVGRSPNGKGHFWAINPVNYDDFSRGEYKRKRAPKRNRESSSRDGSPKRKVSAKGSPSDDKTGEDPTRFTTHGAATCNTVTVGSPNGLEKRGFHIETLLSNPWEQLKSRQSATSRSAFTVVSTQGLLSAAEHRTSTYQPVLPHWAGKPIGLYKMPAMTFYDKALSHVV